MDPIPDGLLGIEVYEAIDTSSAPVRAIPVNWDDEAVIYSLSSLATRTEEPRPVVVACDEFEEQWVVVDDLDRGFHELEKVRYPWIEEQYDEVPDGLAGVPPGCEMSDEAA